MKLRHRKHRRPVRDGLIAKVRRIFAELEAHPGRLRRWDHRRGSPATSTTRCTAAAARPHPPNSQIRAA